jgi:hypothetical protein
VTRSAVINMSLETRDLTSRGDGATISGRRLGQSAARVANREASFDWRAHGHQRHRQEGLVIAARQDDVSPGAPQFLVARKGEVIAILIIDVATLDRQSQAVASGELDGSRPDLDVDARLDPLLAKMAVDALPRRRATGLKLSMRNAQPAQR